MAVHAVCVPTMSSHDMISQCKPLAFACISATGRIRRGCWRPQDGNTKMRYRRQRLRWRGSPPMTERIPQHCGTALSPFLQSRRHRGQGIPWGHVSPQAPTAQPSKRHLGTDHYRIPWGFETAQLPRERRGLVPQMAPPPCTTPGMPANPLCISDRLGSRGRPTGSPNWLLLLV